jgi:type IV pilus assembly protein PilP
MMKWNKALSTLALSGGLLGCQANDESIEQFIVQTEQAAQRQVAALTPQRQFVAAAYSQRKNRGPFTLPRAALVQSQPRVKADCWQPRIRNKTGRLERFPLDKLRLKGVMGSGGAISGLIQTPDGGVYKVKPGQYLGLNHGRIIKVTPNYLIVKETFPDGVGCWQQRRVRLALK